MNLGTYLPSYTPWTPSYAVPEVGEAFTWDWLDAMGQFSQRFNKIATTIATLGFGGTAYFNYGTVLNDDYFPPILKAYYHAGGGVWKQFDFATTYLVPGGTINNYNLGSYARDHVQFRQITNLDCYFVNHVWNQYTVWQLIAYM